QKCAKCSEVFQDNDTKHHCRACGEGFCDSCSSKNRPVPERGWGLAPVRVCDACFQNRGISEVFFFLIFLLPSVCVVELLDAALEEEEGGTLSRRVGEAVQNTLGAVVTATYIPLGEYCSLDYSVVTNTDIPLGEDCSPLGEYCSLDYSVVIATDIPLGEYCSLDYSVVTVTDIPLGEDCSPLGEYCS
uniref:FYVE-type domain-containing protein n=1 Tax=Hucho hucho TaxID=62062 RepID=A0A4W5LY55_9TELE